MKDPTPWRILALLIIIAIVRLPRSQAQVPQLLSYQGRVISGGANFTGTGAFKFALINSGGTATYWNNDGAEPTSSVGISVINGLYSVFLGDTTLSNMRALPPSVFNNPEVQLRIWFDDGLKGSQLLSPDQRIAAVAYAMVAQGLASDSSQNTVAGSGSLAANTDGLNNTALGFQSMVFNSTGSNNTAIASQALKKNVAGSSNTAVGYDPLYSCTGNNNIAIGVNAGYNLTTGDYNIDLGPSGVAGESYVMRLGYNGTFATYVAGISGTTLSPSGAPVYVNSNGQLGTVNSRRSRRWRRICGKSIQFCRALANVWMASRNNPR